MVVVDIAEVRSFIAPILLTNFQRGGNRAMGACKDHSIGVSVHGLTHYFWSAGIQIETSLLDSPSVQSANPPSGSYRYPSPVNKGTECLP